MYPLVHAWEWVFGNDGYPTDHLTRPHSEQVVICQTYFECLQSQATANVCNYSLIVSVILTTSKIILFIFANPAAINCLTTKGKAARRQLLNQLIQTHEQELSQIKTTVFIYLFDFIFVKWFVHKLLCSCNKLWRNEMVMKRDCEGDHASGSWRARKQPAIVVGRRQGRRRGELRPEVRSSNLHGSYCTLWNRIWNNFHVWTLNLTIGRQGRGVWVHGKGCVSSDGRGSCEVSVYIIYLRLSISNICHAAISHFNWSMIVLWSCVFIFLEITNKQFFNFVVAGDATAGAAGDYAGGISFPFDNFPKFRKFKNV